MKVSFVIPAYNEEKYLGACLEATLKEIERSGVEAEVVVVNNASTDRTKEVASRYPGVRVVDEQKKGLVYARKAGYDATSGELVANVDADACVPVGWLSAVMRNFEQRKNLVALSGPYVYSEVSVYKRALVKLFYFPGWLFDLLLQPILGHATMLQGGNFVIRRDAWDKAGGFDTTITFYGEDADVARRISRYGRVRWTWSLPMYASARRLKGEGILTTAFNYSANLLWTHITGRPYTKQYTDFRP